MRPVLTGELPDGLSGGGRGGRRIRDDVRDGVYVMVFSLLASSGTAFGLLLLTKLVG